MLNLGSITSLGDNHTFQHSDGYLRFDSRRASILNLENHPITVGYQNRFNPPPPSYATETAAIYHRMVHTGASQFVYGIYGEVDAYQAIDGGSFTKVMHKGAGDAHYVGLINNGFGYEAAMFKDGANGFIATLQGQGGFSDSQSSQPNAVGFQALWADDGVNSGFVPNYGMFFANNSTGHAFMARQSQFASTGIPQLMVTESTYRNRWLVFGSGATHLYGAAATSGTPQQESPELVLRGHYWNGVNSLERQVLLKNVVQASSSPQLYTYFGSPGAETLGVIIDAYGIDFQGKDIINLDDITFSAGGGTVLDLQGGTITNVSSITTSTDGYIQSSTGHIYLAPFDGYVSPSVDNADSLGSPTNRWKDLWLGSNSLHLYQPASPGPERDWRLGIGAGGDLNISQSANRFIKVTAAGNIASANTIFPLNLGSPTNTNHGLGPNDVIMGNTLEVDGNMFVDGSFLQTAAIQGPNGLTSIGSMFWNGTIYWSSSEQIPFIAFNSSFDQQAFFTSTASGEQFVFADGYFVANDFGHAARTNPTVYIHSANSPVVDSTQWIGFQHTSTDGYIETGKGSIIFAPFDGYVSPGIDDGYSLGSPTRRWKELWLGPDSLHIYQPPTAGALRDWRLSISSAGHLAIKQSADQLITISESGRVFVPSGNSFNVPYSFRDSAGHGTTSGLGYFFVDNGGGDTRDTIAIAANGTTYFTIQAGPALTTSISIGGGNSVNVGFLNSGAWSIASDGVLSAGGQGLKMWVAQTQDAIRDVRVYGSADAYGEYAVRIGTKYTAAEGGVNAILLQIGLDMDGTPIGTHEFYGDGRFATKSSTGHAIILRHTGQDGYIQTTLGHISLAPQDGYEIQ